MRKLYTIAAFALSALAANAQQSLSISTYIGTNVQKYHNQNYNVSMTRYLFTGWNTVCFPFDMTEQQINNVFGADCKLEKLIGVENDGTNVRLNFQDCKAAGIMANVPYILHYTGETGNKKITIQNALIQEAPATLTYTAEGTGETVIMGCAKEKKDAQGLYGVLAKDNSEAKFVNVDEVTTGFYATRCFVQLSSGNAKLLNTNHVAAGDVSSISAITSLKEKIDVYNLSGRKVAENIWPSAITKLQKGIYVVNGKKVMVK